MSRRDVDVAADCILSLARADLDEPEARVGAYMVVEFLAGFRALLKGLSARPGSKK